MPPIGSRRSLNSGGLSGTNCGNPYASILCTTFDRSVKTVPVRPRATLLGINGMTEGQARSRPNRARGGHGGRDEWIAIGATLAVLAIEDVLTALYDKSIGLLFYGFNYAGCGQGLPPCTNQPPPGSIPFSIVAITPIPALLVLALPILWVVHRLRPSERYWTAFEADRYPEDEKAALMQGFVPNNHSRVTVAETFDTGAPLTIVLDVAGPSSASSVDLDVKIGGKVASPGKDYRYTLNSAGLTSGGRGLGLEVVAR